MRINQVCVGLSPQGELLWGTVPMERWQEIQLFKKNYSGDFGMQWMRVSFLQKTGKDDWS